MSKKPVQKIDCNVINCTHNCIDDCTCKLEEIQVCPCSTKGSKNFEDETACSMYLHKEK
ncbi:MAG: DUF1540 domain-containing protein [Clostridia bacterium]